MAETVEKRGPIEKTKNGWPINPLGVIVLVVFLAVVAFLVINPLLGRPQIQSHPSVSGQITSPMSGQITKSTNLPIEISLSDPTKVAKVQFWAKTYVDNKWEIIGEVQSAPYKLDWQVPQNYQNKAVAITTHIYLKDGSVIGDPGGWREGIIILNP